MGPFSTNEWLHIGAGALALSIGLVPLLSVKGGQKHRRYGLKMTGFYFAMASAGAGNLLRGWQPWSQLLPSALGALTMCALVFIHLRHRPA